MPDRISNIFLSIFEGWAGLQSWEGFNGIIEVGVTFIMGNSEVKLLGAHINQQIK